MLQLTETQLYEAIEHLYKALGFLESVLAEIQSGAMEGMALSEKLGAAWFEVNCCRIYTEPDIYLEELNIEAMGLTNDAKSMLDSLVSWGMGMTPQGKLSITDCIVGAALSIKLALSELEGWQSGSKGEGTG
jgi:hypothetical protein